jgi:voltage-gated potassium channel
MSADPIASEARVVSAASRSASDAITRSRSRKQVVRDLLDPPESPSATARCAQSALLLLIIANVLMVILETVESIRHEWAKTFFIFEAISVAIFTVEYILRIWSAPADARYPPGLKGRLRFALRPMLLIDLLAILPFYLSMHALDLRVLRVLRLMRVARIAKLGRYNAAVSMLRRVLYSEREGLLATLSFLLLLVLIASTLMYFVEHETQPAAFSSIPASMWWGIMTITTVGYGDIYPVTAVGKILAAIIAVAGIGGFAMPTAILGAGFLKEFRNEKHIRCPHCGNDVET